MGPIPEPDRHRPTERDRTCAMICHVAAYSGIVVPVPFASVLGPLIAWLVVRKGSRFADEHGREALNFQVTVALIGGVLLVTAAGLFWTGFQEFVERDGNVDLEELIEMFGAALLPGIGLAVLGLYDVVLTAVGAVRAYAGERFHYPATIRFF